MATSPMADSSPVRLPATHATFFSTASPMLASLSLPELSELSHQQAAGSLYCTASSPVSQGMRFRPTRLSSSFSSRCPSGTHEKPEHLQGCSSWTKQLFWNCGSFGILLSLGTAVSHMAGASPPAVSPTSFSFPLYIKAWTYLVCPKLVVFKVDSFMDVSGTQAERNRITLRRLSSFTHTRGGIESGLKCLVVQYCPGAGMWASRELC